MIRRAPVVVAWLSLWTAIIGPGCGKPAPGAAPDRQAAWSAEPLNDLRGGGAFIYGRTAGQAEILKVWRWTGTTMAADRSTALTDTDHAAWAGDGRYVTSSTSPNGEGVLTLRRMGEGKPVAEWKGQRGWSVERMDLNRSGRYVAAYLKPDVSYRLPGHDFSKAAATVALVDLKTERLDWVATFTQDGQQDDVRQVLASDDGAYVALAGWGNGVAMVDVKAKKALWQIRPGHEVMTCAVAFSADGRMIYSGGSEGHIYAMDTLTGKVLWDWYATPSGDHDGTRIVELAASADGRFLAVSTAPDGRIYLVDPGTGKKLKLLQMPAAGAQALTFSPDSKVLAAAGGAKISLWDIPAAPPTAPTTAPASGK